ncbi:STE20-related kinase adapter protein alpha [Geodia barretti]|uniref:STE20-related kinase adapter protein alpha n=1 Tax=Geodia barretti TaxID=519541 RepID=A0AA35SS89_GEOBA|nr:STE20-related kinase adapter protein alpha [Geodia barretti]
MLPCFCNLRKVGPKYPDMLHSTSESTVSQATLLQKTSKLGAEYEATPISSDYLVYQAIGSCADIMHSAQPFRNGFKEPVISIILRDIVSGLQYLHSLGFVHRSVRAKHFLIHEDGIVKLSGLRSVVSMIEDGARVKALHGHFTGTVDNICWLAPELLSQDLSGYSFQSDVYSVGIAALELATGEAPFAGLPVTEIMMLKLRGHPPVLMKKDDGEKDGQISTHLSKVIDLCVDPDPSRRPSPAKLLNTSLLKVRKKVAPNTLKDLLLPVVPLDTSKLNVAETGLESMLEALNTTTTEIIWT